MKDLIFSGMRLMSIFFALSQKANCILIGVSYRKEKRGAQGGYIHTYNC